MKKIKIACEMEVTLHVLGGKWKAMILYYLAENEVKRFNEIQRYIGGISQKTLTNQLKELEKSGIILREAFPTIPPKVEYQLTAKGKTLIPILDAMCEWGEEHMDSQYELLSPMCGSSSEENNPFQ